MLEIMQFYVSGFWAWVGLTIGMCIAILPLIILASGLLGVAVRVVGVKVSTKDAGHD